ncbi:MAG: diguanylate cyclase [Nitrospirota bacterium]
MQKNRIMVVEDEGIIAMNLKSSLESMGYVVTSTEFSGEEAVRNTARDRPDLVLMDIVLSGEMDGIEAAGKIHSDFNTPVIYITAHSDEGLMKRIKKTEPFGYIVKPFEERELAITVETAIYRHEMEKALKESEKRYKTLFESAADAIYLVDSETLMIIDSNSSASEMTGYTIKELKTMTVGELHPQEEQEVVRRIFRKVAESGSLSDISEINQLSKNGRLIPVEINATTLELADIKYILCILRDVSKRKKAEMGLKYEKDKLIKIMNSMEDGVYIVNKHYGIEYLNPVIRKEYGAVTGHKCYKCFYERKVVCPWCKINEVLKGESIRWEWFSQKNQKTYDRFATPLVNPDGSISKLEILHDISKRKLIEKKLRSAAITDELTGLFNRRGFFTLFQQHRKLADRNKRRMSLLYMDMDGLKNINDELGHKTGDQAILDTAGILRKTFRESDVIARIGGDEFAVLLTEPSGSEVDNVTIKHLQKKLETHNSKISRNYELLLSMGITQYDPEHPCSIDELLVRADHLMYRDKKDHKLGKSDNISAGKRISNN